MTMSGGLAAARAMGDGPLSASLDREAELLGLPVGLAGQRRYAFGVLPVGDAFVAWARSRTPAAPTSSYPCRVLTAPSTWS